MSLIGQGYWLEEQKAEVEELTWTSSHDGRLGTGRIIHPQLSQGRHRIILRAGRGSRAGEAVITLDVVETARR